MAISLSSITTGVNLKAPKIVVYGGDGIGKTSFAAGAPKPIFAFTEDGQGSLDVARFPGLIKTWVDIVGCAEVLYNEEHDYQTFVLDSIDFAEPLLWAYTAAKGGVADIEKFGFGKGYGYAVDEAMVLFGWLDLLRDHKGMAIIIIGHSEIKKFSPPEAEAYDRYKLQLQERLANKIHSWSDAVLFAQYKAHIVKDKEAFGNERKRAVGTGERVLYTEERPAFRAKNRYGLPPEIPLSWGSFQNSIVIPETKQEN